jgi:hypothetical protein
VSTRVFLFSDVVAAEILLMKRKLGTLKVVANRLLDGITCKSPGGQEIGHPALRVLIIFLKTWLHNIMCDNNYIKQLGDSVVVLICL